MVQLQLDVTVLFWKIPPDVICTHVKPGDTARLALRFDNHTHRHPTLDKVSLGIEVKTYGELRVNSCRWVPVLQHHLKDAAFGSILNPFFPQVKMTIGHNFYAVLFNELPNLQKSGIQHRRGSEIL